MPKYSFPGGTPVPFKCAFAVMMINIVCVLATAYWCEHYASRQPAGSSVYPIHYRGGVTAFVPRAVGLYFDWGLWVHLVLMGGLGAMLWYYVHKGSAVRVR